MKVTKAEVKESLETLLGGDVECELYVGKESNGDVVIVALPSTGGVIGREFAQAFSIAVMGLAKKHGEVYTPYIMGAAMFERYKAYNGFAEADIPDVAKERWCQVQGSRDIFLTSDADMPLVSVLAASDKQMLCMTAASQMLSAMEEIIDVLDTQQSWWNHASLVYPIRRCMEALAKARGEEA